MSSGSPALPEGSRPRQQGAEARPGPPPGTWTPRVGHAARPSSARLSVSPARPPRPDLSFRRFCFSLLYAPPARAVGNEGCLKSAASLVPPFLAAPLSGFLAPSVLVLRHSCSFSFAGRYGPERQRDRPNAGRGFVPPDPAQTLRLQNRRVVNTAPATQRTPRPLPSAHDSSGLPPPTAGESRPWEKIYKSRSPRQGPVTSMCFFGERRVGYNYNLATRCREASALRHPRFAPSKTFKLLPFPADPTRWPRGGARRILTRFLPGRRVVLSSTHRRGQRDSGRPGSHVSREPATVGLGARVGNSGADSLVLHVYPWCPVFVFRPSSRRGPRGSSDQGQECADVYVLPMQAWRTPSERSDQPPQQE